MLIFWITMRVPMSVYLAWAHPAWTWHYLVDPQTLPLVVRVAAVPASLAVFALVWLLAAWLMSLERRRLVLALLVLVTLGSGAALVWYSPRLLVYGTYEAHLEGITLGVMEVKLGYALIAWLVGTLAAASHVAIELRRDARRARA